ncbi:hypothetical protein MRB53_003056 [Persea americana]|uniref:Uncharacterized protein n=1 Tax=Persea americana TaxID=3435 RepID=A0ACC2MWJ8_PERAE|nr:hypothetical protein MRB53_003056 [Persea americana]
MATYASPFQGPSCLAHRNSGLLDRRDSGGYGSCCHIAFLGLSQDVVKFQQKAQNEKFCTFFPGSKAERNVQQRK